MRVHLREFLATGVFPGVTPGITRDGLATLLGPPDYTGGVSRKHKRPLIWVFGGVEFHFGYEADSPLWLIHFDHPHLPPAGCRALQIDPWVIAEGAPYATIADACKQAGISLTFDRVVDDCEWWLTAGKVTLGFSTDPGDMGLAFVSRRSAKHPGRIWRRKHEVSAATIA